MGGNPPPRPISLTPSMQPQDGEERGVYLLHPLPERTIQPDATSALHVCVCSGTFTTGLTRGQEFFKRRVCLKTNSSAFFCLYKTENGSEVVHRYMQVVFYGFEGRRQFYHQGNGCIVMTFVVLFTLDLSIK